MARQEKLDSVIEKLPPDLGLLLAALRSETDAKISNLKAWGVAMTLGGGTLGGVIASAAAPDAVRATLSALPFL